MSCTDNGTISSIFNEVRTWEEVPISDVLKRYSENGRRTKRILMFGPTQCGKTTLIMELLGIKEEKRSTLEEILRGGEPLGHSSTSTAIVYNKSNTEKFGLSYCYLNDTNQMQVEEYSKDDFIKIIEKTNKENRNSNANENSADDYKKIYYYYIPNEYFIDSQEGNYRELQIVDLPGFGENNASMREKILQIINYFLPFSAGIVAVVRGNKIAGLKSEYGQLLNTHTENQIAIAVSYAIKDMDDIDNLSNHTGRFSNCSTYENVAESITDFYANKIVDGEDSDDTSKGYLSDKFRNRVFPIEKKEYLRKDDFADKINDKDYLNNIICGIDILRQKLFYSVSKMQNATSVNYCTEQLNLRIQNLDELIKEKNSVINKTKEKITKHIEECKSFKRYLAQQQKIINEYGRFIDEIVKNKFFEKINRIVCSFSMYEVSNYIDEFWKENTNAHEVSKKKIENAFLKLTVTNEFNYCLYDVQKKYESFCKIITDSIKNIDTEILSKGIGIFGKHNKKWKQIVNQELKETCSDILNKLNTEFDRQKKKFDSLKTEFDDAEYKEKCYERRIKVEEEIISQNNKKIEELNKEITVIEDSKAIIEKNKKNINKVFIDKYNDKRKELVERIENEKDANKKVSLFLTLSAINLNMSQIDQGDNDDD